MKNKYNIGDKLFFLHNNRVDTGDVFIIRKEYRRGNPILQYGFGSTANPEYVDEDQVGQTKEELAKNVFGVNI